MLDKKGGNVIDDMSMASPATDYATEILGGNIVVPHEGSGKISRSPAPATIT